MEDNVQKIKERVDIVDLISSYLKLQKAGVNYKAKCPFHNEKTPSFSVSAERQIWHCFGCGKGGDQFTFVQEIEGADFPEALRILARRAGVELEHFDRSLQNEKTRLLEICELASRFFEKQLWRSNAGAKVLAYLKDRGVEEDSTRKFQLGYAPDSWDSLSAFLKSRGYGEQEIFNAGLTVKKESGGYYDRFRSRIIFPVLDVNGQTVGFSGRVFPATEIVRPSGSKSQVPNGTLPKVRDVKDKFNFGIGAAKYVNTPQTLIYDKSRVIYGLDKAKTEIRKKDKCVVVEGNMDVILSRQAGAENVVASSGTALTEQHLKTIKRYTNNLALCFDQDSAGSNATERGISLALQQGLNVGVIQIEDLECKDPADYVKKYGVKLQELFEKTKPVVEFFISYALKTFDPETANGKKMVAAKVLPVIKKIPNEVEKSAWIAELALRLKTKEETLFEQLKLTKDKSFGAGEIHSLASDFGNNFIELAGSDILEDYLVSLLLLEPKLVLAAESSGDKFLSPKLKLFFEAFKNYISQNAVSGQAIDYLERNFQSNGFEKIYLEKLYLQAKEFNFNDEKLKDEFAFVLAKLCDRAVKVKLSDLELSIKQSEKQKDAELTSILLKEFRLTTGYLNKKI